MRVGKKPKPNEPTRTPLHTDSNKSIYIHTTEGYLHDTEWDWGLLIQREATEQDLEGNSYLEQVGDIIRQTVVGITHCPYCGERPGDGNADHPASTAEFVHQDFSGWNVTDQ